MANNYRGVQTAAGASGFVGIDEIGVGTGASNTTRPASTGLQNRMQGNVMYLAEGPQCCCFAPITKSADDLADGTGNRPWTSLEWSSILVTRIPVGKGFKGLRINGVYNVESNNANVAGTNDVEVLVKLGPASTTWTLANTQNASNPDFQVIHVDPADGEITLGTTIGEATVLDFSMWVRGVPSGNSASTGTVSFLGFMIEATTAIFDQQGIGPYDTGATGLPLETSMLVVTATEPMANQEYEVIFPVNTTGATEAAVGVHPLAGLGYDGVAATIGWLSWLQLRGLWIRPLYDISEDSRLFGQPQTAIEAQRTFTAAPVIRQAAALREIHGRPRLLKVGPEGILDRSAGVEQWQGRDYPFRWPYVDGDGYGSGPWQPSEASGSNYIPLIQDAVFVDQYEPYLIVEAGFISVQMRGNVAADIERMNAQHDVDGLATWDFELKLHQMTNEVSTDAKWYTATHKNNCVEGATGNNGETWTRAVPMFAAGYGSGFPFLRQQSQLESYDEGNTDIAFSFREGSLYRDGTRPLDERLIHWERFRVKMNNFDEDALRGRPLRVRLEAQLNTVSTYASIYDRTAANVRLVLVGYSIWSEADLGANKS